jgi:hypothetical protein
VVLEVLAELVATTDRAPALASIASPRSSPLALITTSPAQVEDELDLVLRPRPGTAWVEIPVTGARPWFAPGGPCPVPKKHERPGGNPGVRSNQSN